MMIEMMQKFAELSVVMHSLLGSPSESYLLYLPQEEHLQTLPF
jgi:hypothetical protein